MRPKIVILFVILPTVLVLLAVCLKFKTEEPLVALDISSTNIIAHSQIKTDAPASLPTGFVQPQISNPVPAISTNELSPEERQSQVYAEIDRLNDAYAVRDEASKALIVSDLTNSEPEVRAPAVEATKQLGDRSLIPVLQDLATNTADYEEHHALLAAAEFLSMPTADEAEKNWTPNPNAIPVSVPRPNRRHRLNRSIPSSAAAPADSAPPAADQPSETQPAAATGN